ncbi:hypothetical protein EV715DRAFT_247390 [Schizophyllum commune]
MHLQLRRRYKLFLPSQPALLAHPPQGSTGHNGGVNSIAFVGGYPADSTRYVATCGGKHPIESNTRHG